MTYLVIEEVKMCWHPRNATETIIWMQGERLAKLLYKTRQIIKHCFHADHKFFAQPPFRAINS
jgi:hypothetical protein